MSCKPILQNEWEIKTFPGKQKQRELVTSRPTWSTKGSVSCVTERAVHSNSNPCEEIKIPINVTT